jgi:tetratricopeptide (TPR) repeat protein
MAAIHRVDRRIVAAVAGSMVLLGAAIWIQIVRDDRFPLVASDEETLYMTRRAVSRVVFAHRPLAADLYWIRALQYYGGLSRASNARDALEPPPALAKEPPPTYDLLYPLLDITTTLDPRFRIAYRYGAIFLAEPYPLGPNRPDLAITLLRKAVDTMPDKWSYWHDIGFVYYWNTHDYVKAAEAFNRAADLPDAPWWLRSMAATTLARGGQRVASRMLWTQMYASATDDRAREAAGLKLRQLDALEQIEQLQEAVDGFIARTKQQPTTWPPLVAAGVLKGVPLDPARVPYELDESSRVMLSKNSPLFPLPVEPAPRRAS